MLFVLVYIVVPELNIVSDCMKAFLDDPQWPEDIKDPKLKLEHTHLFFLYKLLIYRGFNLIVIHVHHLGFH